MVCKCFIIANSDDKLLPTYTITDTKISVLVVNLLTKGNAKLLEQLKSDFKRTI